LSERPRLSVITICRNSRAALLRTAGSVLPQLGPQVEYLVVDGGSDDGTKEELLRLAAPGVRWVSEPDQGISDAMNKGVSLTTGEWVAHLHAGDTYLPGAVDCILREIAAGDADVLCGWMLKEEERGEVLCRSEPSGLAWDMTVNHPSAIVRRELFDRLSGFDLTLRNAMDYDFFLRAALAGARFRVIERPLTRFASGGQSERSVWKTLLETHRVRQRRLKHGLSRSPAWLLALYVKGSVRVLFQRMGLHGVIGTYRRWFSWPRKG